MSLVASEQTAADSAVPVEPLQVTTPHGLRPRQRLTTSGSIGGSVLAAYLLLAIAAPLVAPYDPAAYAGQPLEWPSAAHWLGTNDVGQDILSELIFGTRASLAVALVVASISVVLATVVGTMAGFVGGWPDALLMRLVDLLLTIPQVPLMIVLAGYLPPSIATTIVVIGTLSWALPARVLRAQTLTMRAEPYVLAARQMGAHPPHIIWAHVLPALGPVVAATFVTQAGRAVALEAGLAFLGLGDPLLKSWGGIMHTALGYRGIYFTPNWIWWLLPAAANVSLLILALTLLGIGLGEWFDPRLRSSTATEWH